MKIYLAGRYSRREELCACALDLDAMGHTVTSRWLAGDHQIDDAGLSVEAKAAERERFATEDFANVMSADMVISFTETPRGTNSRGGRHVEFGIALGTMKRVWIVGPRENVFHCLEDVRQLDTWEDALRQLAAEGGTA